MSAIINLIFSANHNHIAVINLHKIISHTVQQKKHEIINVFLTGDPIKNNNFPNQSYFLLLNHKTLRSKKLLYKIQYYKFIKWFATFLKLKKINTVICDGITPFRIICKIQQYFKIEAICIFHGITYFKKQDNKMLQKNYQLWDLVTVSQIVADNLKNSLRISIPIKVIPNAIDIKAIKKNFLTKNIARQKLGIAENNFVFGCIGRLVNIKRHEFIIEAIAKLKKSRKWSLNTNLVIIGDGSLNQYLTEKISTYNLQKDIKLTGTIIDAYQFITAFDVLLMTSDEQEAFGIVILEGCVAKIPIIASDTPLFKFITGNLATYFSDIESLAMQMYRHTKMAREQRNLIGNKLYGHILLHFDIHQFQHNYWQLIKHKI